MLLCSRMNWGGASEHLLEPTCYDDLHEQIGIDEEELATDRNRTDLGSSLLTRTHTIDQDSGFLTSCGSLSRVVHISFKSPEDERIKYSYV
jgi:hypothetical protein